MIFLIGGLLGLGACVLRARRRGQLGGAPVMTPAQQVLSSSRASEAMNMPLTLAMAPVGVDSSESPYIAMPGTVVTSTAQPPNRSPIGGMTTADANRQPPPYAGPASSTV